MHARPSVRAAYPEQTRAMARAGRTQAASITPEAARAPPAHGRPARAARAPRARAPLGPVAALFLVLVLRVALGPVTPVAPLLLVLVCPLRRLFLRLFRCALLRAPARLLVAPLARRRRPLPVQRLALLPRHLRRRGARSSARLHAGALAPRCLQARTPARAAGAANQRCRRPWAFQHGVCDRRVGAGIGIGIC